MEDLSLMSKRKGLNATQIKTIAIVVMLIDHIAWAFVSPVSGYRKYFLWLQRPQQ